MAEHYSFFDPVEVNGVYDREYNAQEFTDYFGALITTGVMKGAFNMLAVTANGSNMVTSVNTGIAFIEAKRYFNDAPLTFTHDTETIGLSRIDRIVVCMDQNVESRYVRAFIKKGTASVNPVPPTLTQNNTVYEISLAQIRIVGGQTFIASNAATDERGTDIICPWAGSNILPSFDDNALSAHISEKTSKESYGHVKVGTGITVNDGVINTELNNTLTSTSTTVAATANAVSQVDSKLRSNNVKIGFDADAANYGIAIGTSAKAGWYGLALGLNSNAENNSTYNLAIGGYSVATNSKTVAIGTQVSSLNANEGILGSDSSGNTASVWKVPGSFSVTGTKNFEIPHPHPDKKYTHVIRHGAVESPTTGDTLYRYEIEASESNQTVELQLPDYFEHLNTNVDVWVNPHLHFGRAFGIVENGVLKVTCETVGKYKALVIGTRNDDNVQDWHIKGVEREIGESWLGETYVFEVDEISEVVEIEGVNA